MKRFLLMLCRLLGLDTKPTNSDLAQVLGDVRVVECRRRLLESVELESMKHASSAHLLFFILNDIGNDSIDRIFSEYGISRSDALEFSKKCTQLYENSPEIARFKVVEKIILRACFALHYSGISHPIGLSDLLVSLLQEQDDDIVDFLQGCGLNGLKVKYLLTSGVVLPASIDDELSEYSGIAQDCYLVIKNDCFTPMELVVEVLQDFLALDRQQATRAMLDIHKSGEAIFGPFPAEVAQEKLRDILTVVRAEKSPLMVALRELT